MSTATRIIDVIPPVISFDDLSEPVPDELQLAIEREPVPRPLTPRQQLWSEYGYLILRSFMPPDLIDEYVAVRREQGEWPGCTPYMHVRELRRLCSFAGLHAIMEELLGEPAGLHLNLTGWRSTERNWHQDTVLNPPHVGDYYIAAWFALDEIHPDAGPFEFIPGSHKWHAMTQARTMRFLSPNQQKSAAWPKLAERFQVPAAEAEILRTGLSSKLFLPADKGDVLLWHPRLMHRGSLPIDQERERLALIAHYSGINHRKDMPTICQDSPHEGRWFSL